MFFVFWEHPWSKVYCSICLCSVQGLKCNPVVNCGRLKWERHAEKKSERSWLTSSSSTQACWISFVYTIFFFIISCLFRHYILTLIRIPAKKKCTIKFKDLITWKIKCMQLPCKQCHRPCSLQVYMVRDQSVPKVVICLNMLSVQNIKKIK